MQFYGNAERAGKAIVELFRTKDVPAALADIFIKRGTGVPMRGWSFLNQLMASFAGATDARAYGSWKKIGRQVRKGAVGFDILAPCRITKTDEKTGKKSSFLIGFRSQREFDISQTDGEPLKGCEESDKVLNELPLREVAKKWGLVVSTYAGREHGTKGWYRHGKEIALGTKNWATWAHELIHAADDRLGTLKETGQHWASETVAELGGAMLLLSLGYEREADIGGCWNYINHYAKEKDMDPAQACIKMMARTEKCVKLILKEAGMDKAINESEGGTNAEVEATKTEVVTAELVAA